MDTLAQLPIAGQPVVEIDDSHQIKIPGFDFRGINIPEEVWELLTTHNLNPGNHNRQVQIGIVLLAHTLAVFSMFREEHDFASRLCKSLESFEVYVPNGEDLAQMIEIIIKARNAYLLQNPSAAAVHGPIQQAFLQMLDTYAGEAVVPVYHVITFAVDEAINKFKRQVRHSPESTTEFGSVFDGWCTLIRGKNKDLISSHAFSPSDIMRQHCGNGVFTKECYRSPLIRALSDDIPEDPEANDNTILTVCAKLRAAKLDPIQHPGRLNTASQARLARISGPRASQARIRDKAREEVVKLKREMTKKGQEEEEEEEEAMADDEMPKNTRARKKTRAKRNKNYHKLKTKTKPNTTKTPAKRGNMGGSGSRTISSPPASSSSSGGQTTGSPTQQQQPQVWDIDEDGPLGPLYDN